MSSDMSEQTHGDFPRGGAKPLTALETRKIKESAKNDVLFGAIEPEKKKKKRTVKQDIQIDDLKENTALTKKHESNHFNFKYLIKGMLVLGYVKEIHKSEIVIGLPNSLTGYILVSEIKSMLQQFVLDEEDSDQDDSDDESAHSRIASVNDLFTIGQLIPVSVKMLHPSKNGFQKIHLSCFPEEINVGLTKNCFKTNMLVWGLVQSIEDHGYVVSFGKERFSGFLRKESTSFKLGALLFFMVLTPGSSQKVFNLKVFDGDLCNKDFSDASVHFNALLPGQLVKMVVTEVNDDGASGKVCDSFDAIIETLHLMQREEGKEIEVKKKVSGRVLHVNPKTKQIGISLSPRVLDFSKNIISSEYKIGDIINECEVKQHENFYGLFVKMPNGEHGFVHVSRISDQHTEKISKKHKAGTTQTCRVIGYSALESAYTLTMKKSDLDKTFLRYQDLKPGMKISGEIASLEDFGCLVKITDQMRGLCPTLHLSDIKLAHPEKKFQEGKKVKFRVLYVKPDSRELILTHKKTLINSKLKQIVSLDDINVGDVAHGFVSKIKAFGVFINFFNEIKALLPKSEINCLKTESLNNVFFVGQVVQCTVITADKDNNKLVVSLKDQNLPSSTGTDLPRGSAVSAVVKSVLENRNLKMEIDGKEVSFPISHYSDFAKINDDWSSLVGSLPKEFEVQDLSVFGYISKTEETVVTQKQALRSFGSNVNSFKDLVVGTVCGGVVSHIMPYGVFVLISPPQLLGLIPIPELADDYIKTPGDVYHVGQSVIVKVTQIDKEKHRFLLSAKPSKVRHPEDNTINTSFSGSSLLNLYLQQRRKLYQDAEKTTDSVVKSLPTLIGEIIIGKVEKVSEDGVLLAYEVDANTIVRGIIPSQLRYGATFEVGKECQCYVYNIDFKTNQFYATSNEDAIAAVIKRAGTNPDVSFPEEKKLDAVVVGIEADMVVVLLQSYEYTIAYIPGRKHLNSLSDTSRRMKLGQKVLVRYCSKDEQLGVIVNSIDDIVDAAEVKVGTVLTAVVKGIKPTQLSATLMNGKLHGRVHISNIADTVPDGSSVLANFEPLQLIDVKVVGFKDLATRTTLAITKNTTKSLVELSLKHSVLASSEAPEPVDLSIGKTVNCFVMSVTRRCIWVSIAPSVKGRISILHFSEDLKELNKILSLVKPGSCYQTLIIGHNEEHNCTELSRIGDPAKMIKKGMVVAGRISKILDNGLLIDLPNHKAGIANVTEINDIFVDSPFDEYSVNQIVQCYILNVKKANQIDLSLRESRISGVSTENGDKVINGYDDIKEGDILQGYVKTCSKVGVFISLSSNITGRVQIKNLSQFFVKNYVDLFPVGRLVKAKVLSINPSNNNIDLSLRGKDVGGPDLGTPPKRKNEEISEVGDKDSDEREVKKMKLGNDSDTGIESDDDSDSDEDESEDDSEDDGQDDEEKEKPCLELPSPFNWNAAVDEAKESANAQDSDDDSDDEHNSQNTNKKSKRQKRAAKKAEEEYLHKTELALLDNKSQLESAEDFDRLILGSPDSSLVWIQYMAFHLHSAELEKARAIAEKALKTISYREEQEKFNVWVALLNLESIYGSKESLEKCFGDALKVNDTKKVYIKMVDVYIKAGKNEDAERLFQVMLKKFKASLKVWTEYGSFLMRNGQIDSARKLLQRSLKSLPQRKHIENIVKFAVMEYKMGEPNRGSTIFESILKNYPKRTDLWSIYIDMSIKDGDLEHVRNIFERAITLVINSKKMKFLFKRYLNFEEQYGTKSTIDAVKRKALDYVENKVEEEV